MFFTSSGLLMTIPFDPEGKELAWGINMTVEQDRSREGWAEFERSGEAARLAKSEYDDISFQPVRSLLDNADDSKARLWTPYRIPDIPTWHTNRCCLIGDAAHALPPNGLGSTLAFEDAAMLVRLLESGNDKPYEQIFTHLERVRRPRIAPMRKSDVGDAFKRKTGPWGWYFKKWLFRGFFWFNSGTINHDKEIAWSADDVKIEW